MAANGISAQFLDENYGEFQVQLMLQKTNSSSSRLTKDSRKWEEAAREVLSPAVFGYLSGAAGAHATLEANRIAFNRWKIIPRMLMGNNERSLAIKLFGKRIPCPVIMAPIALNGIFHYGKENAVARACADQGVPYCYSTAAFTPIEEVASANGSGERWFQLYWPSEEHNDITLSLLSRARRAGYSTLVVTLDLWSLSWRPQELDNLLSYTPGLASSIGFTDPVFRAKFKNDTGRNIEDDPVAANAAWYRIIFSGRARTWADLKFLREHWDGPFVLKGIQCIEDAEQAVQAGVDGIVVSNHGGRQYDGAVGSLDVLSEIVEAVGQKLTVLFDSGIRSGADILKALALGAKAVFVGRPVIYGLSLAGEDGARHVFRCLLGDLHSNLGQIGAASIAELSPKVLRRTPPDTWR